MPRLTKKVVEGLDCLGGRPQFLWDDGLRGFGVKALPTGAKKYVIKYRTGGGGRSAQQRWLNLGTHGHVTCDQARAMAQQALAGIARGEDPQSEKVKRREAPKLIDVWERFEKEYLPLRKSQTAYEYRSQWRNNLEPRLATRLVSELSRAEIDQIHKSMMATPYRANRVLALLSRLMNLAEAWEWRAQGTNPCRHVERFKERPRTRYLTSDELGRLGASLRVYTEMGGIQGSAANVIRLLLLTGARLNEILQAKWAWVAWDQSLLLLPDSKTGAKPIYLGSGATDLLRRQQVSFGESEFIFPGNVAGKPIVEIRKFWYRLCADAKIEGVRIHDLRHTAASVAVGQGASLVIIGRLLGHSQAQTTLRYAHVDSDPALAAANKIGSVMEPLLS